MTTKTQIDDSTEVLELTEEESQLLITWIRATFTSEGVKRAYSTTSYGLKHSFEKENTRYVSNGAFKGAMMLCGFFPIDPTARNATYKIKPVRKLMTMA